MADQYLTFGIRSFQYYNLPDSAENMVIQEVRSKDARKKNARIKSYRDSVKEFERVQIESRAALRAWLQTNHTRTESIWLITYKKHVPGKYVSWDEVVEEALCFGWIDSLPRKLDADRTMLLLSPRRPGSPWSRLNKQRVQKVIAAGLMTPAGQAAIDHARQDGSWTIYDEIEDLVIPGDLSTALAKNLLARDHFNAFSDSSKKGILWWLKSAKTAATRAKRITEIVDLAAHNIRANFPEARVFKQKFPSQDAPK